MISTAGTCVDYKLAAEISPWGRMLHWKSVVIVSVMFLCNLVVSLKVLPQLYKEGNYRTITYYAIFMSSVFGVIMIYREFIVAYQDDWKQNNPERFNRVLISYLVSCEMVLYVGIIGEIFHQAWLMRQSINSRLKPKERKLVINIGATTIGSEQDVHLINSPLSLRRHSLDGPLSTDPNH